jgi:hypothetical protein
MRTCVSLALCILCLALGACADESAPEAAAPATEAVAAAPAAAAQPSAAAAPAAPNAALAAAARAAGESLAQGAPNAPAAADPAGQPPAAPPVADQIQLDPSGQGLQQLAEAGQALEQAIQEAAEAEGGDNCERGYNGLVAMLSALQQNLGGLGNRQVPAREDFLGACRELPPEVQQCMVVNYALAHRAECETAKDSLDPEVRTRIQRMMESGSQ